jgi:hypothetical protein
MSQDVTDPDDLPPAQRPSVLYRPRLFLDGNSYCAFYGDDPMSGCAGYGDTPAAAMAAFDRAWHQPVPRRVRTNVVPFAAAVRD